MAAKWLKQADKATELLFEAEMMTSHLTGDGLDEFLKLRPAQQRSQVAKLYCALSGGRDLVHAMVDSFYEVHSKEKKRG